MVLCEKISRRKTLKQEWIRTTGVCSPFFLSRDTGSISPGFQSVAIPDAAEPTFATPEENPLIEGWATALNHAMLDHVMVPFDCVDNVNAVKVRHTASTGSKMQ